MKGAPVDTPSLADTVIALAQLVLRDAENPAQVRALAAAIALLMASGQ